VSAPVVQHLDGLRRRVAAQCFRIRGRKANHQMAAIVPNVPNRANGFLPSLPAMGSR